MAAGKGRERKARPKPRMSAAKLGEYCGATAARRERIIRDQKFPSDFVTARYRDAYAAIRAALVTGGPVPQKLRERATAIEAKHAENAHQAECNQSCARALRRFASLYDQLPLAGVEASVAPKDGLTLTIEGVAISVYPAAILQRVGRKGETETGALMLVMTQSVKLSDVSGGVVAELLRQALVQAGYPNVHRAICLVVDVFNGASPVRTPAAAFRRLSKDIESACREIATRWPAIAA